MALGDVYVEVAAVGIQGLSGNGAGFGATGPTGATGPQGDTGGASGPQGASGATGPKGEQGASGIGASGAQGQQGIQGASGATGTQGASGIGASGAQGASGVTGASGVGVANITVSNISGATGGATGSITNEVTGVNALRFDRDTGFNVSDLGGGEVKVSLGSAFKTIKVDGQTDLVAVAEDTLHIIGGTGITITTDHSANPQSLTISATASGSGATGATGPQGASGIDGASGTIGLDGATGTQGATGQTGATGIQGASGSTGLTGATGTQGATGQTGATGIQGASGTQGASGIAGATGVGLQGATGPYGATGAQGAGATGATGPIGITGATGIEGPVGASGIGVDNVIDFTTNNTTDEQLIDILDTSIYRSAKYQVQLTKGTNYYAEELLLLWDKANVFFTEYAGMGESLGSFATYYSPVDNDYSSPDINISALSFWTGTTLTIYSTSNSAVQALLSAIPTTVISLNGGAISATLSSKFIMTSPGVYVASTVESRSPLLIVSRIQWSGTGYIELRFTPQSPYTDIKYIRTTIGL